MSDQATARPAGRTICMYAPTPDGGHARYVWELLTALTEHANQTGCGTRFELVTSKNLDPRYRSDRYAVHPILPPLREKAAFRTKAAWVADRLTHYARRERQFLRWLEGQPDIDAVHFQEWVPWLAARGFNRVRRLSKRVFYTVHNVVPHRYPRFVPRVVMDGWIRRACRLADGLFVHTNKLAGELSVYLGTPHPPIHVTPHGVWTVPDSADSSGPSPADRLRWRRLLFFGAIRRNKGLDLLLRTMDHLPGFQLTIAGEVWDANYYRLEVQPLIDRLRASGAAIERIDQFTPDDEIEPLLARHSAVMLPYTSGFIAQSGVVFLALAYGLPVVASEAGGLRELLDRFRFGTTFADPTPEAVATAVRALCEDSELRDGLAGQMEAAREQFSWRRQTAATTFAGYAAAWGCDVASDLITREGGEASNAFPVQTASAH